MIFDIFKTRAFVGEQADDLLIDTIAHEGQWWLVASWLEHPATLERIPERIILMDGLRVRFQEVNQPRFRFLLSNSLPTDALEGKAHNGFVVAIHPAALLESRGPGAIH